MRNLLLAVFGLLPLSSAQGPLVINPKEVDTSSSHVPVVQLDLSSSFNNRGFATGVSDANFDSYLDGFPAQFHPGPNVTLQGIQFKFPEYASGGGNDNVLVTGQTLTPPQPGKYFSIHFLMAAEGAIAEGPVTLNYADGSSIQDFISVDPFTFWTYPYGGDLIFPYFYTCCGINYNRSMIYHRSLWLDSSKTLTSIQLPDFGSQEHSNRLHLFSASLVPAVPQSDIALQIQYARSTQRWVEGTNKTQIFEVIVNNNGDSWALAKHKVRVSINGNGIKTVIPGIINRLQPGDQAVVQVGVVNSGAAEGSTGQATAVVTGSGAGSGIQSSLQFSGTFGIKPYDTSYSSIYSHEAPNWYRNAKFGIFIHWGVYSVPGFGNSGSREQYAEWYWSNLNAGPNHPTQTYQYHQSTYGPNIVYDDFVKNFTTTAFVPKDWVDLIAASGAKYFVPTTKHHDGWALFDAPASSTQRTLVKYGPKRDLIKGMFDAAKKYQPQLRRGTYFSLPEWYSPAYNKYGFQAWLGGPTQNPFTGKDVNYTGFVKVNDFVSDIILPQMQTLANMGTELMWCDVGGPNMTLDFAPAFFNANAAQGRQVSINNRCGLPGDFDTPEYARYDAAQARKWESNLGMDPFSFGYNRATPDSAYTTPQTIVTSLMDIVSKNGNFLLDIGPTGNGTIIPVMQRNLKAAGTWINGHAEAIFNTTYWFSSPEDGSLRYTQSSNAFYITSLAKPGSTITMNHKVPYQPGDNVTVVGGRLGGRNVPTTVDSAGRITMQISQDVVDADQYAWVFKIPFGGVAQSFA